MALHESRFAGIGTFIILLVVLPCIACQCHRVIACRRVIESIIDIDKNIDEFFTICKCPLVFHLESCRNQFSFLAKISLSLDCVDHW